MPLDFLRCVSTYLHPIPHVQTKSPFTFPLTSHLVTHQVTHQCVNQTSAFLHMPQCHGSDCSADVSFPPFRFLAADCQVFCPSIPSIPSLPSLPKPWLCIPKTFPRLPIVAMPVVVSSLRNRHARSYTKPPTIRSHIKTFFPPAIMKRRLSLFLIHPDPPV